MMEPPLNPFPGLRPFAAEEDFLFFGREQQTNELLELLRVHRFLAVVGTSGSGKSSLVRAGLLPALYGGTMVSVGSRWEVAVMRPGGNPIRNLAQSLIDCDLYDSDDPESLPRIMATLRRSRNGLVEAIRQSDLGERHNLLLVVDQFEELFRFRADSLEQQEVASEFAQLLLAAANAKDIPIYVTLTMRSDYLGECAQISGLAEAVNHGEYLIPRLTRDQRRDAIERPVAVGGGQISGRLINQLLNEVGDDVDQLPVLQHTLMRIWDHWENDHEEGEPIDIRHYESVGGLNHALSQHADEVFRELGTAQAQLLCERIFKALTECGTDGRGIRRPTTMATLCQIVDGSVGEVLAVLDAFRKVGRTFVMPQEEVPIESTTVVDISHESLMRVWQRLRIWVDEESQSVRVYRRLAETALLFADNRAGHYREPDLSIASAWREQSDPNSHWANRYSVGFEDAVAFLEESQNAAKAEEEKRELRRQRELQQAQQLAQAQQKARRRSQGFTACAIVATIIVCFFWMKANSSAKQAQVSEALAKQSAEDAQVSEALAKQNAKKALVNEQFAKEARQAAELQREIAESEAQRNRLGLYAASIRQAERELVSSASRNAGLLQLDQWNHATGVDGTANSPAMRDWEWYYLKGLARSLKADPRIESLKLGSRVNFAGKWSPDGKLLAVTGLGKQVLIIDALSKQIIQSFNRKTLEFCPRIQWSPDAKSIAIDAWWGAVEVYDVETGLLTQVLNHNGGNTNSTLSWNRHQNLIAYSLDEGKIGIYDMDQGQLVHVIPTSSRIHAIEWSPDGKQLAYSVIPGGLHVIDFPSLEVSYKLGSRYVDRLRWTPDGTRIICQDAQPSQLFVVTLAEDTHTKAVESGIGGIWGMAMHPDQPWVALSGPRGEIGIFDYEQLQLNDSISGFSGMMVGVDWRPQGDLLFVSGLTQGATMLVDVSKKRRTLLETGVDRTGDDALASALDCKLAPDGHRVSLTSDVPGRILIADLSDQRITSQIETPLNELVYSYAWTEDGKRLAVAGEKTLLVLDGDSPSQIDASFSLENIGRVATLEWSSDGEFLAFTQGMNAKSEWGVFQFNEGALELLQLDGIDSLPNAVSWHPTKSILAVGLGQVGRDGSPVQLWDVPKSQLLLTIPTNEIKVQDLEFSNKGERLAVAFDRPAGLVAFESSGSIAVFSAEDGESLGSFPLQSVRLSDIQWNSTDQRIATSSFDGNVRIWRDDGTELLTLNPFESAPVRSAFWDSSGGTLIACSMRNTYLNSWSIEDSLNEVSVQGSPELLGNLVAKAGTDPEKIANVYAASGKFADAAKTFETLAAENQKAVVFPTRYWRLRDLPGPLSELGKKDLLAIDPPQLELLLSEYLTPAQWQPPSDFSNNWEYVGLDSTRFNLRGTSSQATEGIQVVATRYYSSRPTSAALVLGGGENVFVWHNGQLVIEHDRPGTMSNGELGAVLELQQGWNDLLFVVYSETQKLELEPYLLDTPERILANSSVTWDGISNDQLAAFVNASELSESARNVIEYQIEIQAGKADAADAGLRAIGAKPHATHFAHAAMLHEAGRFQQALKYAEELYEVKPSHHSAFTLGACLAVEDGISLVSSDATWHSYSSNHAGADFDIPQLLAEKQLGDVGVLKQEWSDGGLIRCIGNGGFPRSISHGGADNVVLLQTTFENASPLSKLLFEIDTLDGFVVYLDGIECYRDNLKGIDTFNVRGQQNSPQHNFNYSRRQIPLMMELAPGKHELAVSVHQDASRIHLDVRCPTLTGFSGPQVETEETYPPEVELAYHLVSATVRGHFAWKRVNDLIEAGIDPLYVEDQSRHIYAVLESTRSLTNEETATLGKLLSVASLPARSFNIALAIEPNLRKNDPDLMHRFLRNWQRTDANDARLIAAQLLEKIMNGKEAYRSARDAVFQDFRFEQLNSNQQLLISALSLAKLTREQADLLSQWKSQSTIWSTRSSDGWMQEIADALLAKHAPAKTTPSLDGLLRFELAETNDPIDRYLVSAVLRQSINSPDTIASEERRALQDQLHREIVSKLTEPGDMPVYLEQWIKYQLACTILSDLDASAAKIQ